MRSWGGRATLFRPFPPRKAIVDIAVAAMLSRLLPLTGGSIAFARRVGVAWREMGMCVGLDI